MKRIFAAVFACAAVAAAGLQHYNIETIAGTDFAGDGRSAKSAALVQPQAVVADRNGNIYFSDPGDHRVRRVTPAGIIQTVAGTGVAGYKGDRGPAMQAQVNAPYGLALDALGNLFIAELGNGIVRRVGLDGTILTVAGGGELVPEAGIPVPASRAKLSQPRDLAADRFGNLFISDFGGNRVYQLTPDGVLTTVAGSGSAVPETGRALDAKLSHPAGLAFDSKGALYVADSGNNRVLRIIAGLTMALTDINGLKLPLWTPTGVAVDMLDRVYVSDLGSGITVVNPNAEYFTLTTTVARGLATTPLAEVLYTDGRQVLKLAAGPPELIAGAANGTAASGDGRPPTEWRFNTPSGLARDIGGNLFIADTANGRVRRLTPSGELSTVTTQVAAPVALAFDSQSRLHVADKKTGAIYRLSGNGKAEVYAQGTENRPFQPSAIVFDAHDQLYIADTGNSVIRRAGADGIAPPVAGGGNDDGDTAALLAHLSSPAGLAFDSAGNLWFTEAGSGRLRKLTTAGRIETMQGTDFNQPWALRIDSDGNRYVSDTGNHRVVGISAKGTWVPLAGSGDRGFSGDSGPALAAMLNTPSDLVLDPNGSILIADSGNNRIRRLNPAGPVEVPPAALRPVSIRHAATLQEQALAPGQLAYLAGIDLADQVTIAFGALKATVLGSKGDGVLVQVPPDLAFGSVEVKVSAGEATIATATAAIVPSSPGVLTASGGAGQASAMNEDGSANSPERSAARGSVVALYVTGASSANAQVTADLGGLPCEVVWSGAAPGLTGLMQVNVRTPSGFAPGGIQSVVLTVGGSRSQPGVTIATR